jgi:hypothetical protein
MSTDDTTIAQPDDATPAETPPADRPPAATPSGDGAEGHEAPSWVLHVAAVASIGAGVIHATATGAHGEHRQAAVAFAVLAALQVGWGVLALVRSLRGLALAGAVLNTAAVAGWALAKTSGISFIDGFEEAESVQFADAAAAALGAVAVLGALAVLVPRLTWTRPPRPLFVGAAALAATAVAIPGMVTTGNHDHGGGPGHSETAAGHAHGEGGHASNIPAKPYDATLPVDLSGVPGVTAEQQREAEELLTRTLEELPQFADPAYAESLGYRSIGDGATGFEHYNNWAMIDDEHILDPSHPESLVYRVDGNEKELAAVMFLLRSEDTLETVPDIGGELIQWHIHNDLCYAGEPMAWRVAGVAPPSEECPPGTFRFDQNVPMMHVWIVPHVCGPFAALEGVAGGQIQEGEERACDHHHGASEDTPGAVVSENGDLGAALGN